MVLDETLQSLRSREKGNALRCVVLGWTHSLMTGVLAVGASSDAKRMFCKMQKMSLHSWSLRAMIAV